MSDFDWFKMINTHLSGTFFCTREALKIMNKSNSGSIINMGSVLGTTGLHHLTILLQKVEFLLIQEL